MSGDRDEAASTFRKVEFDQDSAEAIKMRRGEYEVKGGGPQTVLAGGMVRSSSEGKVDYSLALDGVMFGRLAEHLTKATRPPASYPKRNWLQAGHGSPEDKVATLDRYRESLVRHFIQWFQGNQDEDHAAAMLFNLNGYETLKATMP